MILHKLIVVFFFLKEIPAILQKTYDRKSAKMDSANLRFNSKATMDAIDSMDEKSSQIIHVIYAIHG